MRVRNVILILCVFIYFSPLYAQDGGTVRDAYIQALMTYRGVPYRYGGMSTSGIDCSGLVSAAAKTALDISLPRTVSDIVNFVSPITAAEMLPGDIVFFRTTGTSISHVGVYIGDGKFIHAASEGDQTGVIITELDKPYWRAAYAGSGRIISDTTGVLYKDYMAQHKEEVRRAERKHKVADWFNRNFDYGISLYPVLSCSLHKPDIACTGMYGAVLLQYTAGGFATGISGGIRVTGGSSSVPFRFYIGHKYAALYAGIAPGVNYSDSFAWEAPVELGVLLSTPSLTIRRVSAALTMYWGIKRDFSDSFYWKDFYRSADVGAGIKIQL